MQSKPLSLLIRQNFPLLAFQKLARYSHSGPLNQPFQILLALFEFGGGSPTPFSSRSTLAVVTFRATGEGAATVSFDSASALAAEGLGTDVL